MYVYKAMCRRAFRLGFPIDLYEGDVTLSDAYGTTSMASNILSDVVIVCGSNSGFGCIAEGGVDDLIDGGKWDCSKNRNTTFTTFTTSRGRYSARALRIFKSVRRR